MPPKDESHDILIKMLDERHEQQMAALEKISKYLEALDTRTRHVEQHVSILKWAYGLGAAAFGWLFFQKGG